MHIGTVQVLPRVHPGFSRGFIAETTSGESVFLHYDHGRKVVRGNYAPLFHAHDVPRRLPISEELVVFETAKRVRIVNEIVCSETPCHWGLYSEYRELYRANFAPFLPPNQMRRFPFLIDVLIVGKGLFDPGPFTCAIVQMDGSIYQRMRVDDVVRGKLEAFFLAEHSPNSGWRVTEFTKNFERRKSGRHIITSRSIGEELRIREKCLERGTNILVLLEVDQGLGRFDNKTQVLPEGIGVQTRKLTVFTTGQP